MRPSKIQGKLTDNPYGADAVYAIRGYRERLTPNTRFKVIEIDFTADPAKDNPRWLAEQYRLLGESKTRREVLRDWTVAAGDAYYPEYANYGGKPAYSFIARGMLRTYVWRGWDFGIRRPVCVWGQIGPTGRVYVLRCIALEEADTWMFLDIVKFLSGEIDFDQMAYPESKALYQGLVASAELKPGPWFPRNCKFIDIGGPEAFNRSASVKPGDPKADIDILAAGGIELQAPRVLVMDRVKTLRRLLHVQRDGRPGIMIEEDCDLIHNMLNGGLGFPKATEATPHPEQPRKDGWWDNIHDALTYPLPELVGLTEPKKPRIIKGFRGGAPYETVIDETTFEPFIRA